MIFSSFFFIIKANDNEIDENASISGIKSETNSNEINQQVTSPPLHSKKKKITDEEVLIIDLSKSKFVQTR